MGYVDRGGGREAKGASLRRSKKNPGAAAARVKTDARANAAPLVKEHAGAPPQTEAVHRIDTSVAILSRKFDADRDKLMERAVNESGVCGAVTWVGEVERQERLLQLCQDVAGKLFCVIGVHQDNVDRTNKKAHQGWVDTTEQLAKHAQCVGILTGLDLTREQATHFSQESLMKLLFCSAKTLQLPVVVHLHPDAETAARFVDLWPELVAEFGKTDELFVVIHDAAAIAGTSKAFLRLITETPNIYSMVSCNGLFDESTVKSTIEILERLPLDRMLLASDSPWHTPQNLTDEYLRTLHNEPANVNFVEQALSDALQVPDRAAWSKQLSTNAVKVFFSHEKQTIDEDEHDQGDAPDEDSAADSEASSEAVEDALVETEEDLVADADGDSNPLKLIPLPNAQPSRTFTCVKCRGKCFSQSSLVTHSRDAPKVLGKGGKTLRSDAGCESTFFLRLSSSKALVGADGLALGHGDAVHCSSCNCKVGTVAQDAACPCGCVMTGWTARIVASRVETLDIGTSDQELLLRAEQERQTQEQAQPESDDDDDKSGKKKKPKQNVKANNRSNMSNFRNKNFAPGLLAQSDELHSKALSSQQDEDRPQNRRQRKGRRGHDSDDD